MRSQSAFEHRYSGPSGTRESSVLRVRSAAVSRALETGGRSGLRLPRSPRRKRVAHAAPVISLNLLGAPCLLRDGVRTDLPAARWVVLVAYLARSGGWVRREALAALFWPDHEDHGASSNLRQTLQTAVRSPLGAALEREPTRVRWSGGCDATAFDELVRQQDWSAALGAYGGTFLDGLDVIDVPGVQEWIEAERIGLSERWRTSALALARLDLEARRCYEALDLAERLVRQEPFDEEGWKLILEACVACDDRRRAKRAWRSACELFERELGTPLTAETRSVAKRLGLLG